MQPKSFRLQPTERALLARVIREGDWDSTLGGYRYDLTELSAQERSILERAGRLPNVRVSLDHDQLVKRLRRDAKKLSASQVGNAFIAGFEPSLTSDVAQRRQGALMNWPQAALLPSHRYQGSARRPDICQTCGHEPSRREDLAELSFEGSLHGGIPCSLTNPANLLAWLDNFLPEPSAEPSPEAKGGFAQVFELIAALRPEEGCGALIQALGRAKLLPNRQARGSAVEALATAGVLSTPEHSGFFQRYVEFWPRQARPSARVEMDPPGGFWRAKHGVNGAAFDYYFGHLKLGIAPRRAAADLTPKKASPKKAMPATELDVGDVFVFSRGKKGKVAGVVVDFMPSPSAGPGPVFRFFDWQGKAEPTLSQLEGAGMRPHDTAIYGMRKLVHRKQDPLYVHLGRLDVPKRRSDVQIRRLSELDVILAYTFA